MVALAYVMSGPMLMAQTPGVAAPATQPSQPGIFSIIPLDGVSVTIVLLSTAAVALIIQGFIKARADAYMPPETVARAESLLNGRNYRELAEATAGDTSFLGRVLNAVAMKAPSYVAMKDAMETSAGEQTADSFRRIEFLNIIGNLGPLLGLLGTVLGMIDSFTAMKMAGGQANPAELAGGISKALAHTFLGLALAVPCLAAFGVLRTLTDRLTVRASLKAEDLLALVKPPEARAVAQPMPNTPQVMPTATVVGGGGGGMGIIPPVRQ